MPEPESTTIWQGKDIKLRPVEPTDWEVFYEWNQDDDMARNLYHIPFPQSKAAVKQWVENLSTKAPENDAFHWVMEDRSGEVAGGIATHTCDRRVGTFSYGLNVRQGHRRKGYAAQAILLVLRYFFQELGYQKASAQVYSFNDASVRLHERLGFQQEGRLRRMVYTNGRHFDILIYGLTTEEFTTHHESTPVL